MEFSYQGIGRKNRFLPELCTGRFEHGERGLPGEWFGTHPSGMDGSATIRLAAGFRGIHHLSVDNKLNHIGFLQKKTMGVPIIPDNLIIIIGAITTQLLPGWNQGLLPA